MNQIIIKIKNERINILVWKQVRLKEWTKRWCEINVTDQDKDIVENRKQVTSDGRHNCRTSTTSPSVEDDILPQRVVKQKNRSSQTKQSVGSVNPKIKINEKFRNTTFEELGTSGSLRTHNFLSTRITPGLLRTPQFLLITGMTENPKNLKNTSFEDSVTLG